MKAFKHELGIDAKDLITGFEGVITTRTEHITGCNTYGIQPKVLEGKVGETQWFDENRIIKTGEGIKIENHDDGAGENHPKHHKNNPK
jgi:hypothetical protein